MKHKFYVNVIKRTFDFFCSFLMILILSPVLLLVTMLNWIILRGKAIFKQYRIGKNGKIFAVYKFRSMTNKKDKDGNLLPDAERITKWGKFIRKISVDELPQLFNILVGQMSFIGPRPRMVEECVFLNADQQDRFKVRPGITGWAQVNGRNSINFNQVVEFDKEYVSKVSLCFDIKIVFKTIGYVFARKGINKEGTVSNEFHGDYLLRTEQVSKEYYDEKIAFAKELIGKAKTGKGSVIYKYQDIVQENIEESAEKNEDNPQ